MLSGGHCWAAGRKEELESKAKEYLKRTEEKTVFNVLHSSVDVKNYRSFKLMQYIRKQG